MIYSFFGQYFSFLFRHFHLKFPFSNSLIEVWANSQNIKHTSSLSPIYIEINLGHQDSVLEKKDEMRITMYREEHVAIKNRKVRSDKKRDVKPTISSDLKNCV